jgi:hypothetical protein
MPRDSIKSSLVEVYEAVRLLSWRKDLLRVGHPTPPYAVRSPLTPNAACAAARRATGTR